MKTKYIISLFFFLFGVTSSFSQDISAEQLINNMKYKVSEIKDYTADIEANFNMDKIRMPRIKIKMYYKNPDKYHYESKSFALIPKEGLNLNSIIFDDKNYIFTVKGKQDWNGLPVYVLEAQRKKSDELKPNNTYIWVDGINWVPKKISSEPNEKRKISVIIFHSLIENKYYLPSKIEFEYDIRELEDIKTPPIAEAKKQRMNPRSNGKGGITVTFSNYHLNSGLSDSIFDEKKSK
jgi:outer membrane lipoprotein-sorting protein